MNQQDAGYFSCNLTRDRCIYAIGLLLVFYIFYCYYVQNMQPLKEGLMSNPQWWLGGQRDDTGATNPKGIFGMGFGVEQSKSGVPTNTEGLDFAFGQTTLNAGGFKQTEYGAVMGSKEGLDQKREKMNEKTTESALQAKLFSQ